MDFATLAALPLRNVHQVVLPRRGFVVHVRELLGIEALQLRERISAIANITEAEGQAASMAVQIAAFLCDENGASVCNVEQARQLVEVWYPPDLVEVIKAGNTINGADDQAVEDAAKK